MASPRPHFHDELQELQLEVTKLYSDIFTLPPLSDEEIVLVQASKSIIKVAGDLIKSADMSEVDTLEKLKRTIDYLEEKTDSPITYNHRKIQTRFAILEASARNFTDKITDEEINIVGQLARQFYLYAVLKNDNKLYKYSDLFAEYLRNIYSDPFMLSFMTESSTLLSKHRNWGKLKNIILYRKAEPDHEVISLGELLNKGFFAIPAADKIDLATIFAFREPSNLAIEIYEHVLFNSSLPEDHQYLYWYTDYLSYEIYQRTHGISFPRFSLECYEHYLKIAESLPPPTNKAERETIRKKLISFARETQHNLTLRILQVALRYCTSSDIDTIKTIYLHICKVTAVYPFFSYQTFMDYLERFVNLNEKNPKCVLVSQGTFVRNLLSILIEILNKELIYFSKDTNHLLIKRFLNIIQDATKQLDDKYHKSFKLIQTRIEKMIEQHKFKISMPLFLESTIVYPDDIKKIITNVTNLTDSSKLLCDLITSIPDKLNTPTLDIQFINFFNLLFKKFTKNFLSGTFIISELKALYKIATISNRDRPSLLFKPLYNLFEYFQDIESNPLKLQINNKLNNALSNGFQKSFKLKRDVNTHINWARKLITHAKSEGDQHLTYLVSICSLISTSNENGLAGLISAVACEEQYSPEPKTRLESMQLALIGLFEHALNHSVTTFTNEKFKHYTLSLKEDTCGYLQLLKKMIDEFEGTTTDLLNFINLHTKFLFNSVESFMRSALPNYNNSLLLKKIMLSITEDVSELIEDNNEKQKIIDASFDIDCIDYFVTQCKILFLNLLFPIQQAMHPLSDNVFEEFTTIHHLVQSLELPARSDDAAISLLQYYYLMTNILIFYKEYELAKTVFEYMTQFKVLNSRISEIIITIDAHLQNVKSTIESVTHEFSVIKEKMDDLNEKSGELTQLKKLKDTISPLFTEVDIRTANQIMTLTKEIHKSIKLLESRPEPVKEVITKPRVWREEKPAELVRLVVEKPKIEIKEDREALAIRELNRRARALKYHERYTTLRQSHLEEQTIQTRIYEGRTEKQVALIRQSKALEQKNAEETAKVKQEERERAKRELKAAQSRGVEKAVIFNTLPNEAELHALSIPLIEKSNDRLSEHSKPFFENSTLFYRKNTIRLPEAIGKPESHECDTLFNVFPALPRPKL